METMGDLLESVKEFATHKITKEEAQKLFGWTVEDVSVRSSEEDKSLVIVSFDNKMVLFIHYFLNLDPTEDMDNCEFILALKTDLRSRLEYNVYYSGYIHGQGYMRLTLAEVENRMLQRVLDDFYAPALKAIYKPIIENSKDSILKIFLVFKSTKTMENFIILRFATGANIRKLRSGRSSQSLTNSMP